MEHKKITKQEYDEAYKLCKKYKQQQISIKRKNRIKEIEELVQYVADNPDIKAILKIITSYSSLVRVDLLKKSRKQGTDQPLFHRIILYNVLRELYNGAKISWCFGLDHTTGLHYTRVLFDQLPQMYDKDIIDHYVNLATREMYNERNN